MYGTYVRSYDRANHVLQTTYPPMHAGMRVEIRQKRLRNALGGVCTVITYGIVQMHVCTH
jgi:hypothetical protein